jgi:hypothetical protein
MGFKDGHASAKTKTEQARHFHNSNIVSPKKTKKGCRIMNGVKNNGF